MEQTGWRIYRLRGSLLSIIPLRLILLVSHGFPLDDSDIFLWVLSLTLASLLYIGVFFAIGTVISTYLW